MAQHNPTIPLVCEHCLAPFLAEPYEVKRGRRYCSLLCGSRAAALARARPLAERFWTEVERGPDCWLWRGHLEPTGYGRIEVDRRRYAAHRLAWELAHGPIPAGMNVCHRCDNPPCVNPAHLFLGTQADNIGDKTAKGRQARGDGHGSRLHPESRPRGEQHWSARLTADDVRAIRDAYARRRVGTVKALAERYGMSRDTILKIGTRRLWKHVE